MDTFHFIPLKDEWKLGMDPAQIAEPYHLRVMWFESIHSRWTWLEFISLKRKPEPFSPNWKRHKGLKCKTGNKTTISINGCGHNTKYYVWHKIYKPAIQQQPAHINRARWLVHLASASNVNKNTLNCIISTYWPEILMHVQWKFRCILFT